MGGLALAVVTSLLVAGPAFGAAGDLDTGFGVNGRFVQNFQTAGAPSTDDARDVVVEPNGQILIAGSTYEFNAPTLSDEFFVVLSLSSTGAPGAGGPIFSFGSAPENGADGIGLQPDGKVLLAGSTGGMGGDMTFARLTTAGGYDGGFGGTGHPNADFAGVDGASVGTDGAGDLVRQPDGSVVAAGFSDNQFGIARLNSAGSFDNTFDGNGRKRVDFSGGSVDGATSVALSGSKIVAAGYTINGSEERFAIVSLLSNGDPDPTFGNAGRSQSGLNELPQGANALAVQPDGKILVAGLGGGNFGVGRVKTDGLYDPTFGPNGNGQVAIDFGGNDVANAISLQPDGKILVAGTDGDGFAVARLMPNGSLDSSFGTGGKATVNFTGVDIANGMAIQPDGKIVLVGSTGPAGDTTDFAVTRLLGDPPVAGAPPAAPLQPKKCKKGSKLKRVKHKLKCVKKKKKHRR